MYHVSRHKGCQKNSKTCFYLRVNVPGVDLKCVSDVVVRTKYTEPGMSVVEIADSNTSDHSSHMYDYAIFTGHRFGKYSKGLE